MTIQVGEQWAYREPPHTPGKAATAVEVLQFGPPKSKKVHIRLLAGEYAGLDIWAPKGRLLVPWEEADAYLNDERRYEAAVAASRHVFDTIEYVAAREVLYAYPRPDGILIGYDSANAGVVTIANLESVCRDLSLEREELFANPLAYVDRSGEYMGPWPVALRLACRVAEVYPEVVLDHVLKHERELEEAATWGKEIQWGRQDQPVYVPAERYVEELHRQQPIFALVRTWCSQEAMTRFDEAAALRSEVERLRALVLEAARWLKDSGHPNVARRLRKEVGVEPEPRTRTRG